LPVDLASRTGVGRPRLPKVGDGRCNDGGQSVSIVAVSRCHIETLY